MWLDACQDLATQSAREKLAEEYGLAQTWRIAVGCLVVVFGWVEGLRCAKDISDHAREHCWPTTSGFSADMGPSTVNMYPY